MKCVTRLFSTSVLLVLIITGCSSSSPPPLTHKLIAPEVTWNNHNYFFSGTIFKDEIGQQIGTVDDSQMINCSECKGPPLVKGDKLYQIKNTNSQEEIAGESGTGTYYRLHKQR